MKYIIFSTFLFQFFFTAQAQKAGVIEYETTVNLHKFMTGENAKYKEFMPEFKTSSKKLIFNENASLFENLPKDVETVEEGNSWGRYEPDNKHYINLKTKEVIKKIDFMGKVFIVSDSLTKKKWKITGKTKSILNMPCISAEFTDTIGTYTVWFTPKIPVQIGPSDMGSLPGLILEFMNQDTSIHIKTVNWEPREVKDEEIEQPSKGKKMTSVEFNAMVEEKMKQFEEQNGTRPKMRMGMH